jgi:hypothetical protein
MEAVARRDAAHTIHSFRPARPRASGASRDCPNEVDQKQLDDLYIQIVRKADQ